MLCRLPAPPRSKDQWTNAPTHPPLHRGRINKWRAAPRLPEPLDRRGWRMVGRCSGGRSRRSAHSATGLGRRRPARAGTRATSGGQEHRAATLGAALPVFLRTAADSCSCRRCQRRGWWCGDDGSERHRPDGPRVRGAARPERCGACLHGDRGGTVGTRGGSVSLFVRHVLVVASRCAGCSSVMRVGCLHVYFMSCTV